MRSRPERETVGLRNSPTTASRPSSGKSSVLRGRELGLKLVRRMAPIVDTFAQVPLPDALLGDPVVLGHDPRRLSARLDLRRRRPRVKRNQLSYLSLEPRTGVIVP